jgi:hypothetical protein
MTDISSEIHEITAGRPELAFPHTMAQRINREWKPFGYLVTISITLVEHSVDGTARILITLPPAHGKTLLIVYYIIWYLNLYPSRTVIFATHTENFAQLQARTIRNIIIENEKFLTVRLAQDSKSTERFHTPENGGLVVASIGSGLIGHRANLVVIDDIYKSWEDSQNPRVRKRAEEWLTGTVYSRLQPKGNIVVVGARWHSLDLQSFLINEHSDEWVHLNYPALAEGEDID